MRAGRRGEGRKGDGKPVEYCRNVRIQTWSLSSMEYFSNISDVAFAQIVAFVEPDHTWKKGNGVVPS